MRILSESRLAAVLGAVPGPPAAVLAPEGGRVHRGAQADRPGDVLPAQLHCPPGPEVPRLHPRDQRAARSWPAGSGGPGVLARARRHRRVRAAAVRSCAHPADPSRRVRPGAAAAGHARRAAHRRRAGRGGAAHRGGRRAPGRPRRRRPGRRARAAPRPRRRPVPGRGRLSGAPATPAWCRGRARQDRRARASARRRASRPGRPGCAARCGGRRLGRRSRRRRPGR
jgi:hypothetical protein